MKWILVLIIIGYGGRYVPAITAIEFPTAFACHKAFKAIKTNNSNKAGTCLNKETGEEDALPQAQR